MALRQPTPDIPSPCRRICRLDANRVCVGCGRTRDEIARWSSLTNQEKHAIYERLQTRSMNDPANQSLKN